TGTESRPRTMSPPSDDAAPRQRRIATCLVATALGVAAIVFDPVPAIRGPAPYPPEWHWLRRDAPAAGPLAPALATVALLLLLLRASDSEWARRHARAAAALVVAAAVVLAFVFQLALLELEPAGAFASIVGQTVYRTATSYYTVAVSDDARDPLDLLRRYDELLPAFLKSAKHASTHPPGPVLLFRGLLAVFDASPGATHRLLAATARAAPNPRRPRSAHALPPPATALSPGSFI